MMSATSRAVAGEIALASAYSPVNPCTSQATSSAACGGQTERMTSAWPAISGAVPASAMPAARARAAVSGERSWEAQSTSWPASARHRATALPISPGWSSPMTSPSMVTSVAPGAAAWWLSRGRCPAPAAAAGPTPTGLPLGGCSVTRQACPWQPTSSAGRGARRHAVPALRPADNPDCLRQHRHHLGAMLPEEGPAGGHLEPLLEHHDRPGAGNEDPRPLPVQPAHLSRTRAAQFRTIQVPDDPVREVAKGSHGPGGRVPERIRGPSVTGRAGLEPGHRRPDLSRCLDPGHDGHPRRCQPAAGVLLDRPEYAVGCLLATLPRSQEPARARRHVIAGDRCARAELM